MADLPTDETYSLEERLDEFLRLVAEGENTRSACGICGIAHTRTVYRRRDRDPVFAAKWEDAKKISVPQLEAEANRRAMQGSDKLMIFMLTNRAPEKYKTSRTDVDVSGELDIAQRLLAGRKRTGHA